MNTGCQGSGPSQFFASPPLARAYRACSSRVRCFPDTRKECGNSASVSSRTCSEIGGRLFGLVPHPTPPGTVGWKEMDSAQGTIQTPGTGVGSWFITPLIPGKCTCAGLAPQKRPKGLLEFEQLLNWPSVSRGDRNASPEVKTGSQSGLGDTAFAQADLRPTERPSTPAIFSVFISWHTQTSY